MMTSRELVHQHWFIRCQGGNVEIHVCLASTVSTATNPAEEACSLVSLHYVLPLLWVLESSLAHAKTGLAGRLCH